jgi:phosphate starvation-inducible PhoH-like protein
LQSTQKSGLIDAIDVLDNIRGIAFTRFNSADVVRHPLVARIVDAYEAASAPAPVKKPASRLVPKK